MIEPKKILITGVAGFIGSALAKTLIQQGHDVIGIDNLDPYYPRYIKLKRLEQLISPSFRFYEKNIAHDHLDPCFKNVEIVFHLAAQAGVRTSWGETFAKYADSNVLGTQRLLEASAKYGVRRFVFASSSSVYGQQAVMPIQEDAPLGPISPYGITKVSGEQLCRAYENTFGLEYMALRYFSVYGPGQRPDAFFYNLIHNALTGKPITVFGTGEQTRDFTYIDDLVQANILAMNSSVKNQTFNISSEFEISVNNVISTLKTLLKDRGLLVLREGAQNGDIMHSCADIGKAKNILGYKPSTIFFNGFKQQMEWMKTFVENPQNKFIEQEAIAI